MSFLSRISIRLLAFNLLLVFIPAAGLLYLDIYEKQLLEAQERAMVQQARLISAALSGKGELEAAEVEVLLTQLRQRLDSRLRVVDRQARLLGDTSRLGPREAADAGRPAAPEQGRGWLYRIGASFYQFFARALQPPEPILESGEFYGSRKTLLGAEVRAALSGRYGAITRVSAGGQRSVTLYSAIPIESGGEVVGAVLVSQSTYRILKDLYSVRLTIFKVCLASAALAIVLSLLVSTTIARPLRLLRDEASAILDRRGRLKGSFRGSRKADEIGDLSRALEELTRRLDGHLRHLSGFAADVSHEFKNPLASIRTATEMLSETEDPEARRRFRHMIERDVARLENLLSEFREITLMDASLEAEKHQPVLINALLEQIAESFRLREHGRILFAVELPEEPLVVLGSPERLSQVFENVLDNAVSFSPDQGTVRIALRLEDSAVVTAIQDQGQGIPEEHRTRIFDRFFSYRPHERRADGLHTGLGLAIVKTILEAYGGAISAENDAAGGARFEVRLPVFRTGGARFSRSGRFVREE